MPQMFWRSADIKDEILWFSAQLPKGLPNFAVVDNGDVALSVKTILFLVEFLENAK